MVLRYGELTENTVIILDPGVTNFPCKAPDSEYFRLCESYSLCHKYMDYI